jgi:hypothetical protein
MKFIAGAFTITDLYTKSQSENKFRIFLHNIYSITEKETQFPYYYYGRQHIFVILLITTSANIIESTTSKTFSMEVSHLIVN